MTAGRSAVEAGIALPLYSPDLPVAIVGAGSIGARVAWVCARAGLETRIIDPAPGRADEAKAQALGRGDGRGGPLAGSLIIATSLEQALTGVQLAFESVPESLTLKQRVLAEIDDHASATSYIGSNTSSLLCSSLANATRRPERVFNLNFGDPYTTPLVELMGCARTAPTTLAFARAWAEALGMTVLQARKEQMGYVANRMWRVIKKEALRQIAEGVATAEDIDRGWMLSYGGDIGPCGMMDDVGLATVAAVEDVYFAATSDASDRAPDFLREMIASGCFGVASGRGFYGYPDPEFRRPDFLSAPEPIDETFHD